MANRSNNPVPQAWDEAAFQAAEQTLATSRFVRVSGTALSILLLGVSALVWFVAPEAYWGRAFCGIASAGLVLIFTKALSTVMLNSAHQLIVSVRHVRLAERQMKGRTSSELLIPQWLQRD